MASLEEDLTHCLREMARSKEQEKKTVSDKHRNDASQQSRLQAQHEGIE